MYNVNINKNETLSTLEVLLEQNISRKVDYFPEEFNEQQQMAFELFKKRIYLEKTVEETVTFNRNLNFDDLNPNIKLTTSAEELIEVYKLRSDVYSEVGYKNEFPDVIEGLNFDSFDNNSAIVFYENNKQITGTTRLVFDSDKKLPSEEKFTFDSFRNEYDNIGEVSRLMIKHETNGLNLEFKNLTEGIYKVYKYNEINLLMSSIKKEHYKLYSKFGGFEIVETIDSYGKLNQTSLVLSWDPSKISKFFKKAFLS